MRLHRHILDGKLVSETWVDDPEQDAWDEAVAWKELEEANRPEVNFPDPPECPNRSRTLLYLASAGSLAGSLALRLL